MRLDGMHHLTMITGDAQRAIDFYAGTLGLRLVKQTVNFDRPDAYHLYFGDERGSPGSILTWFQFPGAAPGRAGAGMVGLIELGVASEDALDVWTLRLAGAGVPVERQPDRLRFSDPDGLGLAIVVDADGSSGPPLRAEHPEISAEDALTGVVGARAYAGGALDADRALLTDTLGFTPVGDGAYRVEGDTRRFSWAYDPPPGAGIPGAGTVHHIAWHSRDDEHAAWRERAERAGMRVTPIIDRDYFRSIYFRQPQGVLFEIATTSPGFAVDEDPAQLGEALCLPAQHEHLRSRLEATLTPLVNPRAAGRR